MLYVPKAHRVSSRLVCQLAAVAGLLAAAAPMSNAQSVDVIPSYHPNGTIAGGGDRIEFYAAAPFRIEASLPGLSHTASQAVSGTWFTMLAVAGGTLSTPIPLGPGADLWLDPASLQLLLLPFSLELEGTLSLTPGSVGLEVDAQLLAWDVGTAGTPVFASAPVTAAVLPPAPSFDDRMIPLGTELGGNEAVFFEAGQNRYHLRHTLAGVVTDYVLDLDDLDFSKGTLSMDELTSGLRVIDDGGVRYVQGPGAGIFAAAQFQNFGTHTLLAHGISGKTVWFDWQDVLPKIGGGTVTRLRRHEFTLHKRSVEVHVFAQNPSNMAPDNYFGFNIGGFAKTNGGSFSKMEKVRIPYMDQIGVLHLDGDWFLSSYTDLFRSNAGFHTSAILGLTPGGARFSEVMNYPRNDDFTVNVLDESSWVTVSKDVTDLFVKSTAPPSPYAAQLRGKVGVTLGIEATKLPSYQNDVATVSRLKGWFFDEIFMFKFHWMNEGTNRRAPTHNPPNPEGGTESEFRQIIVEALSAGWKFALYTDFFSLDQAQGFDDNQQYSEGPGKELFFEAGVKEASGAYRLGYNITEQTGVPGSPVYNTRVMAPRRAPLQWEREAKVMVDDYGVNASYYDVMTITAPDLIATALGLNVGGVISQESKSPNDQTLKDAIASYKALFAAGSSRSGGPVVGEGSFGNFETRFDSFYAGYLDATYRTLSTIEQDGSGSTFAEKRPLMVDYELEVNHDRMFGFGMGQYARFFDPSAGAQIPLPDPALEKLRAVQISYGHNGYFLTSSTQVAGTDFLTRAQRVKEYYTMQSLSAEWATAKVTDIAYRAPAGGAPWLSLTEALNTPGFDFVRPVLRVRWNNGLEVFVNHSGQNITALGYQLPPYGWAAENPDTGYVNLSILEPTTGTRVDIVRCADYELADGNGVAFDAGLAIGMTTELTVRNHIYGKTLAELADGSISVQ